MVVAEAAGRERPKTEGGAGLTEEGAKALLADLCATYQLVPEEIYAMPRWQLMILAEQASRVEARRLHRGVTAAMAPHLKDDARRDLLRSLERMSATPAPMQRPASLRTDYDPAAAAEWFRSRGVRVETP